MGAYEGLTETIVLDHDELSALLRIAQNGRRAGATGITRQLLQKLGEASDHMNERACTNYPADYDRDRYK